MTRKLLNENFKIFVLRVKLLFYYIFKKKKKNMIKDFFG